MKIDPPQKVVFYIPRSTSASILGVVISMIILMLPTGLLGLIHAYVEPVSGYWMLFTIGIGIFLAIKSEPLVYPVIGTRTSFVFDADGVTISQGSQSENHPFSSLKSLDVLSMPLDSGSVRHVRFETTAGKKYDIFETWVTGKTMQAFNKVYTAIEQPGPA